MAELIHEFAATVPDERGTRFIARAYAQQRPDGSWEGWLEFVPDEGSTPLRTDRETTQRDRDEVVYWASGLEPVYLEGALQRALRGTHRR